MMLMVESFLQSILIHSAAGGVGIAAIQIAQMVGATVSPRMFLPPHSVEHETRC